MSVSREEYEHAARRYLGDLIAGSTADFVGIEVEEEST